jgi:predicted nucleic acid-binding protein
VLVSSAAEVKSGHALSYADAFCVATALRYQAAILTSDPEFASVSEIVKIHWLPDEK